jgi:peroxiredoxin
MLSGEQAGKKVKGDMQRFIQTFKLFSGFLLFSLWVVHSASAAGTPLRIGGRLPAIRLPFPKEAGEKSYLGVSGQGPFRIHQIRTTVILIEIFSLYCPQCQASAPEVNALYQIIEQIPDIKDRIKMIGIGAGNSVLEVNTFKNQHGVPFPLFPDPDFKIHKHLGEVRTPYFIVVKIKKDRTSEIVHLREGALGVAEIFLQKILRDSGLKR